MSIGLDIKEVHAESGTSFTILRDDGDISGEWGLFVLNRQITKPFIREFFLDGAMDYDTQLEAGDVIQRDTTGDRYLTVNKIPRLFENEVIEYSCTFYKSNVTGVLKRLGAQTADANYRKNPSWATVKDPCYALLTESLYGNNLQTDLELGWLGLKANELYIPSSVGVLPLDRFLVSATDYFMVETVNRRRFNNVDVAILSEDTRP